MLRPTLGLALLALARPAVGAPACDGYTVSGAGNASLNGCYKPAGQLFGAPRYVKDSFSELFRYCGVGCPMSAEAWRIGLPVAGGPSCSSSNASCWTLKRAYYTMPCVTKWPSHDGWIAWGYNHNFSKPLLQGTKLSPSCGAPAPPPGPGPPPPSPLPPVPPSQRTWMDKGDPPAVRAAKLLQHMSFTEKTMMLHARDSEDDQMGFYIGLVETSTRLGMPWLRLNDGPQGFNDYGKHPGTTTNWPSGLTIAASFDQAMARLWGESMGAEFRGKGANVQLGPGLCVARLPLNGRNFEYMSGEVCEQLNCYQSIASMRVKSSDWTLCVAGSPPGYDDGSASGGGHSIARCHCQRQALCPEFAGDQSHFRLRPGG